MLLKREIGPEIVAIGSGRGHYLKASWERFFGARMPLRFRIKLASISLQHEPGSGHDQATIGVLRRVPSAVRWSDRDEDPMRQVIPRSFTGCR